MITGRRTVGAAASGLFVTETDDRAKIGIQIYTDAANTGVVYVGNTSTVTANTSDTLDGYPLPAGKELLIPERNPNNIYVVGDSPSQKFWFIDA